MGFIENIISLLLNVWNDLMILGVRLLGKVIVVLLIRVNIRGVLVNDM